MVTEAVQNVTAQGALSVLIGERYAEPAAQHPDEQSRLIVKVHGL
jgi:hypothetical protein